MEQNYEIAVVDKKGEGKKKKKVMEEAMWENK